MILAWLVDPRNVPRVPEDGPPFILDKDPRLYRPTVSVKGTDRVSG
jgi:hypothetical protein